MIYFLTGLMCNGKTSLLPALKYHLEVKYPEKRIIAVKEPVRYLYEDVENYINVNPKLWNKLDRQAGILAISLAQYDLIQQLNDLDTIIIMDRSFIDVLIYTYLNEDIDIFKDKVAEISSFIDFLEFRPIYIKLPEKYDVLEKCLNEESRKVAIEYDIYEMEKRFYERLYHIFRFKIKQYNHPADNSYVLYEILNDIEEDIKIIDEIY